MVAVTDRGQRRDEAPTRGRPRRAEVDGAVLDATRALIAEHGYENLRMNDVAARAGVAKTTVYRRWPSKIDLVLDAVVTLWDQVQITDRGSVAETLRAVVDDTAAAVRAADVVLLVLLTEAARDPAVQLELHRRLVRRVGGSVRSVVAAAVAGGQVPHPPDPDLVADLVLGPLLSRLLVHRRPLDAAFRDDLVGAVLRAVGAAPGPPSGVDPPPG